MNSTSLFLKTQKVYGRLSQALSSLQGPLLLFFRLYWGWQFFETGKGKLTNIGDVTDFFMSLGVPFPTLSVYVVGTIELLGGSLLILGLASRLAAIPLSVTMIVAFLTADYSALTGLLSDPDAFVQATPFPFLITSLLVLAFGPGRFSLDHVIGSYLTRKNKICRDQKLKGNA